MPKYDDVFFEPPAPIARVTLRHFDGHNTIDDVPMLLDNGADVTLVPRTALIQLGAAVQDTKGFKLVGFDGSTSTASVVPLELLFCMRSFRGQFLVIDQEWGVLGRNVLNCLRLLYDGPKLAWSLYS